MEIVNPAIPASLKKLGYTEQEASAITDYVMRKETRDGYESIVDGKIEGAPYLKEEHLSVFDTASKCGTGMRFISPEGHVKMMGALTPHITGAISKTVNLPNDATVDDVKNIYKFSWELGVKSIALYRDGCKTVQPLSASNKEITDARPLTDCTYQELIQMVQAKKTDCKPLRVKPSGIRVARVHEAAIGGLKLYITTSFYEDGRLGEIYVSSGRQGSFIKGLLDSISTTISKMLQYSVSPEDIARMYRGQKFEPSGFVSGHPYIRSVDSISDLISKIIDIELGDYTYCQVKPASFLQTEQQSPSETATTPVAVVTETIKTPVPYNERDIIYGDVCTTCQSTKMVKNGTCKVCTECGTTSGCS